MKMRLVVWMPSFRLLLVCAVSLLMSSMLAACSGDDGARRSKDEDVAAPDTGTDVATPDAGDVEDAAGDIATPDAGDVEDAADDVDEAPTACTSNDDCPGTVCDLRREVCLECLYDSQCGDGEQCQDNRCYAQIACDGDEQCPASRPVCHSSLGECVACEHDLNCGDGHRCVARQCVAAPPCTNTFDCSLDEVCHPDHKVCVGCASDADCSEDETCRNEQCQVVLRCGSDRDCRDLGMLCDVEQGECRRCLQHADCPDHHFCYEGDCRVGMCNSADESSCRDGAIVHCEPETGLFVDPLPCEENESCRVTGITAVCEPWVCQPGTAMCEDDTAITCSEDGLQILAQTDCAASDLFCIEGRCLDAECLDLRAMARIAGTNRRGASQITAGLGQLIELSPRQDFRDDDFEHRYEWAIVTRPHGSQSQLTPDNTVARPKLWIDVPGTYKVELAIYDANDNVVCEPSMVTIHVYPGNDIRIELTWKAEAVPQPRHGHGTDVDLHYLHPLGRWDQSPYDIYWNNRNQNWGTTSAPSIAKMDADDLYGVGPEIINHENPADGLHYSVGVYYYSDKGHGPADATVRIYVRGQLQMEIRDRRLPASKYFWYVGVIQWPSGNIVRMDQVHHGFP